MERVWHVQRVHWSTNLFLRVNEEKVQVIKIVRGGVLQSLRRNA